MVTFLPISSPFIRFAGRFVDDAFGFAAGWNFFVFEAALVPFEIVACNVIIGFWSDVVPTGAIIAIVLVLYAYVTTPHPGAGNSCVWHSGVCVGATMKLCAQPSP